MQNQKLGLFGLAVLTALGLGGCTAHTDGGAEPTNEASVNGAGDSADSLGTAPESGSCNLDEVNSTCTEYTQNVAEAEGSCSKRGGIWSSQKCPPSMHTCCSWDGARGCAYTSDAAEYVFDACLDSDTCDCVQL